VTSPLRPSTRIFIFQLYTCGYSPYVTSSLMKGWVCPLPLLLRLRSKSHGTTFYYLRFETPPTWRARPPYLYPPGTGCPSYTIRYWLPFSLPSTTLRATVEVFNPASTREESKLCYDRWSVGGTDHVENTTLPSNDPTDPLLFHVHLLLQTAVYRAVA
jgi:hypothetical protein